MWLSRKEPLATAAMLIAVLSGCFTAPKPLTYLGHADLQYYKDIATKVDYPDNAALDNPTALVSKAPRRVRHPEKDQIWDLTLAEAIQIALRNNKVIRTRDQANATRNSLVANPDQSPSRYDSALQETGVLYYQRGVEAALSDFDAQFTTSMTMGYNDSIVNNNFIAGGIPPGLNLMQDTAAFKAKLEKTFADSSVFSVSQNWDYLKNNEPGNLFAGIYTGFVRADLRKPLLAGSGLEYTRIAGPRAKNRLGVAQGVVISRINNDIAIADFEAAVQTLVRDVQTSYWDLALAYRTYHAQVVYWENAFSTWQIVNAKLTQGLEGGKAADEAQARDNLFDSQGHAQEALGNLYTIEGQFRRLLGLPVNDGRVIRPCDELAVAEFVPDWHIAVAEGIVRRPEIRKQKWNIKSLELQVKAAKNLTQPELDFVAGYQVNAFGNHLISSQSDPTAPGGSAFASLAEANWTGWNLGLEAAIPLGYRNAHAQVRNLELRVAKARCALATQELDISHEIRQAFQVLDRSYAVATAAFNRRVAAEERVQAYKAQYEWRGEIADPLLRAQQSLVQAEIAYFQALVEYNKAITDFYYRTGTILEEANVHIAEDTWDPPAYANALRRAWARSHAVEVPYLQTVPAESVVPPGKPVDVLPKIGPLSSPPPVAPQRPQPMSRGTQPPTTEPQNGPRRYVPPPEPGLTEPKESEPALPLPTPSKPLGVPQASTAVPTRLSVITPVSGINPLRRAAPGADFHMPAPSRPAKSPRPLRPIVSPNSSVSQAVPPGHVRTPAASRPAPPALLIRPFVSPRSQTWSTPKRSSASGSSGPTNSFDETPSTPADPFDMPLRGKG